MQNRERRGQIVQRDSRHNLVERFAYQENQREQHATSPGLLFRLWHLVCTSLAVRLMLAAALIILVCVGVLVWLLVRNPVDIPQLETSIRGDAAQFSVSVEKSGYRAHNVFDNKTAHITLYMKDSKAPESSLSDQLSKQLSVSGLLASSLKQESALSIFDYLQDGAPVLVVGDVTSSFFETVTWQQLAPDAFTPVSGDLPSTGQSVTQPDASTSVPTAPKRDTAHIHFANYYAKVPSSKVFDHLEDLSDQQKLLDGERLERYRADSSSSAHKELLQDNRIALYKGTTNTGVYWALLVQYQNDGVARICLLEANHPAFLAWLIDHKGML